MTNECYYSTYNCLNTEDPMNRTIFAILFLLILLIQPLISQEKTLVLPEYDTLHGQENPSSAYFFPFPPLLRDAFLTLEYRSDLSCLLVLEGMEGKSECHLLPPLWGDLPISEKYTLTKELNFPLSSISLITTEGDPIPFLFTLSLKENYQSPYPGAQHSEILDTSRPMEGDYILNTWEESSILIIEFADYQVQDRYFKRLAFFMEKPGYRGTLMTNEQMEGLHGWNAHDYSTEGLASFYNLVKQEDFPLNQEEWDFLQILLIKGILTYRDGIYDEGVGAVISITRESSAFLRHRFIVHETLHGIFFTDAEVREEIRQYWFSLTPEDRQLWRLFMQHNFYDPSDEVLMYNELMGYTLQLYRAEVVNYFTYRFNRTRQLHPEVNDIFEPRIETLPEFTLSIYDNIEKILSRSYSYKNGSFDEMD